ncbi:glycosyltransferase family 2 protein [Alienimonas californiensis]|uniref:Chondroitin synthase n=1 Tax=Alienimonas californiensis TaxID=2527989 RepID=A0A517P469_9PLAN|nr:glycosyltransferase [Alienimonas californiensis]QDT14184.1 Chondroitin synthase [Alienimonas californiensis]
MTAPAVSVLMPCYNAARYLPAAAGSVLSQTLTDFEVVAVDDGSTDGTKALLDGYAAKDPRVRVISRPNTGIVGALNDGLEQCRAPLVARMDADDVCHPDRLRRQVAFLRDNPECVAVGTFAVLFGAGGRVLDLQGEVTAHKDIVARVRRGAGGALLHASAMFRQDALRAVGGYRKEFAWVEDLDLYLRLADHGTFANLPRYFYGYRKHPGAVCRIRRTEQTARKERALAEDFARSGRSRPPALSREDRYRPADPALARDRQIVGLLARGAPRRAVVSAAKGVLRTPLRRAAWDVLALVSCRRPPAPHKVADLLDGPQLALPLAIAPATVGGNR